MVEYKKKPRTVSDTEFSVEFGEVNGKKLTDFPLKRKEKKNNMK